jgi:acyl-CoA synthetase (NDP forming)
VVALSNHDPGKADFWQSLFAPDNVAMVGASDVPGSWGFNIMQRLIKSGNRRIYPVNPSHPTIQGMATFRSVADIADTIDLAVIAVPAHRVPAVMRDCVSKGIKAAVVISGGFSEADDAGKALEQEVVAIARGGGLRFVGPNTMGHADTYAQFSILGFMGPVVPGPVAFAAQSGNMGSRIMQLAMNQGIGFSEFVCTGNEASIRLEDYLEHFAHDDHARAIALYIEGLREASRFLRLAKETTVRKPIVVMKSGNTRGSTQAARSHTGALAGSEAVYTAAFKQAGVIRAENEDEMADVLAGLIKQPLPRGRRVAILTMGGGFGVVTAEACEKEGLEMAALSPATIARLDSMLPARWPHGNPVDLAGMDTMGEAIVLNCLSALLEDEGVDSLLSLVALHRFAPMVPGGPYMPTQHGNTDARAENLKAFGEKAARLGKPVLSIGALPPPPGERPPSGNAWDGFSIYPSPQRAARVLRHLLWYRGYLEEARSI